MYVIWLTYSFLSPHCNVVIWCGFPRSAVLIDSLRSFMIKGPELFTGMDILPPKNIDVKEPEFMTKVIAKLRFESLANDSDDSLFGYTDV